MKSTDHDAVFRSQNPTRVCKFRSEFSLKHGGAVV